MPNDKVVLETYESSIEDDAIFCNLQCGQKIGKLESVEIIESSIGKEFFAAILYNRHARKR